MELSPRGVVAKLKLSGSRGSARNSRKGRLTLMEFKASNYGEVVYNAMSVVELTEDETINYGITIVRVRADVIRGMVTIAS